MDPSKILERFLDRPRVAELRRRARRLRPGAGWAPRQRPGLRGAVRRVPGRPRDARRRGLARATTRRSRPSWRGRSALLLPPLRDLVDQALLTLSDGAAITSVVGLVGLIWTVSQFYVTLDVAFARIFADRQERNVFRRTARGFVSVAGLVGVVVALIVGGSLAAAAEAFLPASSTALIGLGRVLSSLPVVTAIGVVAVAVVYRVVPPRSPSWSAVVAAGRRGGRGDRPAQPAVPVRGAATDRRGVAHRARWPRRSSRSPGCRSRSRCCCSARPGSGSATMPALPRPRAVSPGGCRSAGRTGRSRRVTARS